MTSQIIPRGRHPGPQRGEVLGTEEEKEVCFKATY
jgi:hypothetical protein